MSQSLPAVISFGEALTDLVRVSASQWQSHVGGSTWNLARALKQLGVHCAFAGGISSDVFGQALLRASEAAGLDPRFIQTSAKSPLLAVVHQVSPPAYFFIGDDSADLAFDPEALPAGWREAVQWAHFGGISLAREPLAGRLVALAGALKAAGKKVSYDPNYRVLMDHGYDATLQRMCELADVIKVSDEDLRGLFRTNDADAGLARLRALNPSALVMLTRGAEGASLYIPGQSFHAVPPAIEVVDTIGAGDASMAGLLDSLTRAPEREAAEHLRWAVAAGSAACLATGATPPSAELVATLASGVRAERRD